jgi:hypothetical protein
MRVGSGGSVSLLMVAAAVAYRGSPALPAASRSPAVRAEELGPSCLGLGLPAVCSSFLCCLLPVACVWLPFHRIRSELLWRGGSVEFSRAQLSCLVYAFERWSARGGSPGPLCRLIETAAERMLLLLFMLQPEGRRPHGLGFGCLAQPFLVFLAGALGRRRDDHGVGWSRPRAKWRRHAGAPEKN